MRRLAAIALGMLVPGAATADPIVSVEGAWCEISQARPENAFVYLTLTLQNEDTDVLLQAMTDAAKRVDILTPRRERGRLVVRRAPNVKLDAGAPTVFQPQDTHLVLAGLKRRLGPGDRFTLTLDFATAGKEDVIVPVVRQPPSAGMPDPPPDVKME